MANNFLSEQLYINDSPMFHYARFLHQPRAMGVSGARFVKLPPIARRCVIRRAVERANLRYPQLTSPLGFASAQQLYPICHRPATRLEAMALALLFGRKALEEAPWGSVANETSACAVSMFELHERGVGEVMYAPGAANIPVHIYERVYEHQLEEGTPRRRPEIASHYVLLLIFSFIPAEMPTLLSVGLVSKAWRERSEFLAPHWDLVVNPERASSYWDGRSKAQIAEDEKTEGGDVGAASSHFVSSNAVPLLGPFAVSVGAADDDDNDTALVVESSLFRRESDGEDTESEEDADNDAGIAQQPATGENEPVSPEVEDPAVAARRLAYFPLQIQCRTDLLIKVYLLRIRDEETESCVVKMRTLGGVILTFTVLFSFILAAVGAYYLGKKADVVHSYGTMGVIYFFSALGLGCICRFCMLIHWCCPTIKAPFQRGLLDLVVQYWGAALLLVVGLVMALLCLRLRVIDERIDLPTYHVDSSLEPTFCPCGSYGAPSCSFLPITSNTTAYQRQIPSTVVASLPAGLSHYEWVSNSAFTFNVIRNDCKGDFVNGTCTVNGNYTTSIHFLLAAANGTPPGACTGGGGNITSRMVAFQVEGPYMTTQSFSVYDPLIALSASSIGGVVRAGNSHDGAALEMKVPFISSVLDCGFDIEVASLLHDFWYVSPGESSTRWNFTAGGVISGSQGAEAAQYLLDSAPHPWRDAAIPILPWGGGGGVRELVRSYIVEGGKHPWRAVDRRASFKSLRSMRGEVLGAWIGMLCGGVIITVLLNLCFCLSYVPLQPLSETSTTKILPLSEGLRIVGRQNARRIRLVVGVGIAGISLVILNPVTMACFGMMCYFADNVRDVCLADESGMIAMMVFGFIIFTILTIGYFVSMSR